MLPIYDPKLIEEVDEIILQLKQKIEQIIKLRVLCAQCEVELAILNHPLCLEIIERTDQFTSPNVPEP